MGVIRTDHLPNYVNEKSTENKENSSDSEMVSSHKDSSLCDHQYKRCSMTVDEMLYFISLSAQG